MNREVALIQSLQDSLKYAAPGNEGPGVALDRGRSTCVGRNSAAYSAGCITARSVGYFALRL